MTIWGPVSGRFHRPCGIGQWLAVKWIIQMLNKCPRSVASVFWRQSLALRNAEVHLDSSFHKTKVSISSALHNPWEMCLSR